MELYNFFSEVFSFEKLDDAREALKELEQICHHVTIVEWQYDGLNRMSRYTIVGQMYGEDTSCGDTDLLSIFGSAGLKYTWFDATMPTINNLQKCKD